MPCRPTSTKCSPKRARTSRRRAPRASAFRRGFFIALWIIAHVGRTAMFRFLGNLVCRAWPALLVGWGGLLLVTWMAAPPWDSVSQDQEFAFLPENVPSRQAEKIFKQ